jgi:hypothetical protein
LIVFEQHKDEISDGKSPSYDCLRSYGYKHFYCMDEIDIYSARNKKISKLKQLFFSKDSVDLMEVDRLEKKFYSMLIASPIKI